MKFSTKHIFLRHSEEHRDVAISSEPKIRRLLRFLTKTRNDASHQKAAMFGLDARIALAIFGALSIITGAALYSAIENAKSISILVELKELGKAWEQFYLDTGTQLTLYSNRGIFYLNELVKNTNSSSNWHGPYISYELNETSPWKLINKDREYEINAYSNNMWTEYESPWTSGSSAQCVSSDDCFLWINANFVSPQTTAAIKRLVDGNSTNLLTGNFRAIRTNDSSPYRVYLKITPCNKP